MNDHSKQKAARLKSILDEVTVLTSDIEGDEAKNTPENREKLTSLLSEGDTIRKSIEQDRTILGLKGFLEEPESGQKNGDGEYSRPFEGVKSLGEQFVESEGYKSAIKGGKVEAGLRAQFEAKGFLVGPSGGKATFTSSGAGLVSGLPYVGGVVELPQQRLYVRDLMPVGQTTLNSIPYIRETSYTQAADMVAEEGEKPEATLVIEDTTAPVKKIAVVLKVTDEMFADFPMLRDYVNGRLRYMVLSKEEQQLLNGSGAGNQITGLLNAGIQTTSATTPGELKAILTAITKIRTSGSTSAGGWEPDGIIINPTDWEELRNLKDAVNGQYFGGGPFYGPYGQGQFIQEPLIWGLRPVITNAITAGTFLVGAFRMGAQIWQREGVMMDATNSNEDDFNFNRVSLRVEERLALRVYSPKAFCTVTDVAF